MNPFARTDKFESRHIGTLGPDLSAMLRTMGLASVDQLINETIPDHIRRKDEMKVPPAQAEFDYLQELKQLASKNLPFRSFIGQGYYGTVTPSVISRSPTPPCWTKARRRQKPC